MYQRGGLKTENHQFIPTPDSFNALARGDPFRISGWTGYNSKKCSPLRWWRNRDAIRFETILECDRQTDGQVSVLYSSTSACVACYATALVKIKKEIQSKYWANVQCVRCNVTPSGFWDNHMIKSNSGFLFSISCLSLFWNQPINLFTRPIALSASASAMFCDITLIFAFTTGCINYASALVPQESPKGIKPDKYRYYDGRSSILPRQSIIAVVGRAPATGAGDGTDVRTTYGRMRSRAVLRWNR